jgi:hypothetical protein
MSNEVQKIDQLPSAPVSNMLEIISRAASDPNVDIDKLERLMQMKERMDAKAAEVAFNDAMNAAQSQVGRVKATKENKQTRSWYADYAALDRALRPIYVEHGFSLSFNTGDDAPPEMVRVICYVSHKDGHTRTYHVDMPADGKGAKGGDVMTKTHAAGSAMSYGSRYLLKLIFNVAIGEDDDDGNNAAEPIDPTWMDAIQNAVDRTELTKIKADMVKHWGEATRIPVLLIASYNTRLKELGK